MSDGDTINSAAITTGYLCFGTKLGIVHLVSFQQASPHYSPLRSFQTFPNQPINSVTLYYHLNQLIAASCYDNGHVVYLTIGGDSKQSTKDNIVKLSDESIQVITLFKKGSNLLAGTESGKIIHHRRLDREGMSSSQLNILFTGAGSPVACLAISPCQTILAWSDHSNVRVMDISTQTAICFVPSPTGVCLGLFPCSLFWESDLSLLIGWGDSFRQLTLLRERELVSAITSAEWQTDCILCSGVYPFDNEHVVALGNLYI